MLNVISPRSTRARLTEDRALRIIIAGIIRLGPVGPGGGRAGREPGCQCHGASHGAGLGLCEAQAEDSAVEQPPGQPVRPRQHRGSSETRNASGRIAGGNAATVAAGTEPSAGPSRRNFGRPGPLGLRDSDSDGPDGLSAQPWFQGPPAESGSGRPRPPAPGPASVTVGPAGAGAQPPEVTQCLPCLSCKCYIIGVIQHLHVCTRKVVSFLI